MINKKYFLSFILLCNVNNNQCANNTNGDQDPIVKIQQTMNTIFTNSCNIALGLSQNMYDTGIEAFNKMKKYTTQLKHKKAILPAKQSYFDIQENTDIVTAFISIPKYNIIEPIFSILSNNTFKIEFRDDKLTTIIYGQFNNHYLRITMNIKQLIIDGNSSYVAEYNYTHESTIFDDLDFNNISSSYNAEANTLEINIPKDTSAAKHTKPINIFIK